jgi:hypothetical protein
MFDNAFLAERVYLKGSLKNNAQGFEFILYNRIDTGTLVGIKSLSVDGFDVPVDSISIQTPDGKWAAAQVNYSSPIPLKVGQEARLHIGGMPLVPGQHHLVITITVLEIGRVQLKLTDTL